VFVGKALKILVAAKAKPAGVSFADLQALVLGAGFSLARVRGDHFLYSCAGISEIINLQPLKGKAKTYQVRQVLGIIEKYDIVVD
jgi:hypothetical protein